ncbi:hypothetical protein Tco_1471268 [Tanacetum coccineum]
MCDGSVNVKPHQTKHFKREPKKEWKPIKRVWKPISKPVANSKPQWKPTGRHFSLFEKYPLTRIMEPTDMPLELPPSASSSPQITMVSRFIDHKLSDRKAGSTNCSMEKYGSKNRVLAGFGIGGKFGKKVYTSWVDRGRERNLISNTSECLDLCAILPMTTMMLGGVNKSIERVRFERVDRTSIDRTSIDRTRKIQETVHVAFDELTEGLTSVQTSSGLAPQQMTYVPNSTELELTALQSGRSRSALVKDPEPPSVPDC